MAYVIDTRNSDDHLLILGGALGLPTSQYTPLAPSDGSLRYNVGSAAVEVYSASQWHSVITSSAAQPYLIGIASGAASLASNQIIACHEFATAVTFPADFGNANGFLSYAGCLVPPTNLATITIQTCSHGTNPTVGGNWATIGTAVIAVNGHQATLATVGHAPVSVAQGDYLRCLAPSTVDPTFSNFFITLVGTR
jgi:hypothetical protein